METINLSTPADIAAVVASDIKTGGGVRRSIDTRSIVSGGSWPVTFASFVAPTIIEGTSFGVVTVKESSTPVAAVAENATKPTAVEFTNRSVSLQKFAGMGIISYEAHLGAAGLEGAVYHALARQSLMALESAFLTEFATVTGHTYATADDFVTGILEAQGMVASAGGNPSVIAISAVDVAALGTTMLNAAPGSGLMGTRTWGGSFVHVSPKLTAGNAVVLDPAAVTLGWNAESPSVLVDALSMSDTNRIRIVTDILAQPVVTNADLLVPVAAA